MVAFPLLVGLYLLSGSVAWENPGFEFINEQIRKYVDCLGGTEYFEVRDDEKFKSYSDIYPFTFTEKRTPGPERKKGVDMDIPPVEPPYETLNNFNSPLSARFLETVQVIMGEKTYEDSRHKGTASLEVGADFKVVKVSVTASVEGEMIDKKTSISENTTTQIWDRIQVTPPHLKSITTVQHLHKRMFVSWTTTRTVKGHLPIHVKKPGRSLSDEQVWKKCSNSAPIKINDNLYLVGYENFPKKLSFDKDHKGEPTEWNSISSEGQLIQTFVEEPEQYLQEFMRFRRTFQIMKDAESVKAYCRLLNPNNKIDPVVSDMDMGEADINEDTEEIDPDDLSDVKPTSEYGLKFEPKEDEDDQKKTTKKPK